MTLPFGESITRLRAGTSVDPYSGETVPDWNQAPSTLVIGGWAVDDSRSAEPLEDGRAAIVTDFVLYRHEPADVAAGDRVVVRGLTCEVVGRPATWSSPYTGITRGFVVRANIKEG